MTDLLFDVNLQQLPDDFLAGSWRIADRVLNRTNPDSALALATHLQLQGQEMRLQLPGQAEASGHWSVQRDALLQRPYLEISLAEESTRALITRLRRSADGRQSLLNLYFLSGMELQLAQS
ncbi:hypothetical protein [Hymenobacter sp. B81]|uniref:hypothetical protein n=1 Tax=Hymenobacter sp. B81 TaxID=3344878 RepID=UPI0037DC3C34